MRSIWSAVSSPPDTFTLPHEVFELALKQGPLLVYLYLICRKSLKRGADEMNCAVIGKAVGLCEKIVRTHLRTLADTGFIKTEYHGQTFSYTLCPIRPKVQEHRGTMPHSRWISAKQTWINGEVLEAVFPLPNAVFGAAVGMGRKTVQKHVWSMVDKGLIRAEGTTVRRKNGLSYNGSLLYTVRPIEQILKEREKEFLAELKLAEAQRKWDRRSQERGRPRFAL